MRCDLRHEAGTARIAVEEEGIGFSEQEMASIITRVGRIVNDRNSHIGGADLGLFVSREIVRMHGGEISAASGPGRGSGFELRLPLDGSPDRPAGEAAER